MSDKHTLNITWSKAFGEIYCHHASLFIPYLSASLFPPELVYIGVTIRKNFIVKGKIDSFMDCCVANYLPCSHVDGGILIPINSSGIIESLSLNSWTSLKNNVRGTLKEYPINIFYKIEDDQKVTIPFENLQTPYLSNEDKFSALKDGDKIDAVMELNV